VNLIRTSSVWVVVSAQVIPSGSSVPMELANELGPSGSKVIREPDATVRGMDQRVLPLVLGASVIIWLYGFYNVMQMTRFRTPGVRMWQVSLFNKSCLSPEAWPYRRRVMIAGAVFLTLILTVFVV
jgi:hypothetical protein